VGRAEEDLHDELLERVARSYFVGGTLQNDIAAAEHLSPPSVSRLLAEARTRGVVQFRIGPRSAAPYWVRRPPPLSQRLAERPPSRPDSVWTQDAAMESKMVQDSLELGRRCDVALVGVGSMQRFPGTGVYSPVHARELDELAGQGAAGHLCGHFLRADGSLLEAKEGPFLLGIGADELRQIPQRIAVAAGRHKVAPIAAAISDGMISELVTDHATAAELIQLPLG
jgi:DNA-binding transcriptional regulator LsrR (DeoR family)